MREPSELRQQTLDYVKAYYEETHQADADKIPIERLVADAERILDYYGVPDVILVRYGPVFRQDGSLPPHQPKGNKTMQLHDDEQVSVSVTALDAKGYQVSGDAFSATSSDETIVSVTQQEDGSFLVVAGQPGMAAVVTYTDGTLSVTESFDVVPGDVATLQIQEGTPEKQPVATP
jgi:hypothetical protein